MTQVVALATIIAVLPEARGLPDAGAGEASAKGEFSDILQRFGGKSSEADSSSAAKTEEGAPDNAANRGKKTAAISPGAGLHRLLSSERLGPSKAVAAGAASDDADDAADGTDPGDAATDPKTAASVVDGSEVISPPAQAAPAMPVIAPIVPMSPAAAVRAKPMAGEGADADPQADRGGRGVIVVRPEAEDGTPAAPIRVPVTVESVETHFAPLEAIKAPVAEAVITGSMRVAGEPSPAVMKVAGIAPAKAAANPAGAEVEAFADDGDGAPDMPKVAASAAPGSGSDRGANPDADGGKAAGQAAIARSDTPAAAAPASGLPVATIGQVSNAIADAARDMRGEAAQAVGDAGAASGRAVVKVLNVRLDPPEYGSVAVRLTLQGGALSVQIRAERETTAAALDHDREKLAEHLKAAGYGTDASMIDTRRDLAVMRSDGAAGTNGSAGGSNGASGQAAGGQSSPEGAARRESGNGSGSSGQGSARGRGERGDGAADPDPGARGLYV